MNLTHENYDQIALIGISGELTTDEIGPFKLLAENSMEGDTRDFVLDLSETLFIDSQGLETLLWLQEKADNRLGQVRLVALTENVRTILKITRLENHFDTHTDVESAMKSLR